MIHITDNLLSEASQIISSLIDRNHGIQLHDVTMYVPNRSSYSQYRFRIGVLCPSDISKYLNIKYLYEYNIYYFEFNVDLVYLEGRSSIIEQIVDAADCNFIKPLLKALDEFDFDKEVDKLLTN